MPTVKGVLIYSGYWHKRPWRLLTRTGTEIDLFPLIDGWFTKANGKYAWHRLERDIYEFHLDASSDLMLVYQSEDVALLKENHKNGKNGKVALSNVRMYLEEALMHFSGRMVTVTLEENVLRVFPNLFEEVFGVRYCSGDNSCYIPPGAEQRVCKVGTSEHCVFAVAAGGRYSCEKFSTLGKILLQQNAAPTLGPERVRGCTLLPPEEV